MYNLYNTQVKPTGAKHSPVQPKHTSEVLDRVDLWQPLPWISDVSHILVMVMVVVC